MSTAASLAQLALDISFPSLPDAASTIACTGFADYGACLLLGLNEPVNTGLRAVFAFEAAVSGGASLYFSDRYCRSEVSAMLNSAAAHASNIDDNALKGSHVSSVLAPAILAEAERVGANGRTAVAAYVAGYEVWARLAAAETDSYNAAGWHQTTALAPLAVAAAIANLTSMSVEQTAAAIGIAASMTGGLVGNFNPFVKPMQVGRATRAGIEAAAMARAGFISATGIIEGTGGLLAALSPGQNWSVERMDTATWQIMKQGLNLKQYPNAATNHRALDGVAALMREHRIEPGQIERITVPITRHQRAVIESRLPALPARAPLLMIEPAIAALLLRGRLSSADLTAAAIDDADVEALAGRVVIEVVDEPDSDKTPNLGYRREVSLVLSDGQILTAAPSSVAEGHFSAPFSRMQLQAKFMSAAGALGLRNHVEGLFAALIDLPNLDSVPMLPRLDTTFQLAEGAKVQC